MFNTVPDTKSNPIFSSYSVRDANFNENMDEYVKAPNDIYIEEQIKKAKTEAPKVDINKEAMDKIEELPAFLKEEFEYVNKKPEWLEELEKSVATPEDIEEWKKQGSMGVGELASNRKKWGYAIPFGGTSAETTMIVRNANTLRRLKNGEEVSDVDAELLYDFLRESKEREVRGVTFGGKAFEGIRTGLTYLAEFGLGLAAVGADGIGLAAIAKTLGDIGAKKAARKAVEAALKQAAIKSAAPAAVKTTVPLSAAKKIYKDTLVKTTGAKALANVGVKEGLKTTAKGLPKAVATSAAFGNTVMLPHTINDVASKQLATGIYITDFGDAVLGDSENLALSFMKAIGNSTFETLTETVGWMFSPVASYFAKPIQKVLPKKFFTEFEKLVSSRYGMPAANALKKYGYDGVIEEMGEEVLNRFLCQVFGINGLDEYNFDGFMNNVLYANDPSQWGVEALTFAATSALLHGGMGAQSKVAETWKKNQNKKDIAKLTAKANKYNTNSFEKYYDEMKLANQRRLEQFYLEQGLIKINGSQSLAEQRLREVWSEQNINKDLQDSVLKNMSETEIRSELKKATENKIKNQVPEEAAKKIEHDLTKKFMDNKTFAKEKDAKTVAALFSAPLQKLSKTIGISLEELMEEEMPEIQREAEQAAKDNGRYIQTDGRIEEIFNELNNLPNDFADEEYCQQLIDEADILSKIRDGNLEEADFSKAKSLIRTLDYAGYTEFADELRELSYNQTGRLFQSENHEKNLIDNFGISEKDITDNIKADVENLLSENDIAPEEFTLEDIRLYGSYSKGTNKNGSDLDFVVLYSGDMSEDSAFNILNDVKLTLTDKDGNEIEVDINPINKAERGSIEDYLSDIEKLEPKALFQTIDTAGVEGSAEISAAKKEWKEKGTFDETNPNIYYQGGYSYRGQLEDVKSNLEYKKFVNKVLSGNLSQKEKRQVFRIGRTPAKLIEAGLPDNDISIGYKIIEKAQNNKNADHNLSQETISEVWNALKNPIAVIKAEQNKNEEKPNNRYSAILDLQDNNGKFILVAFEADKNFGKDVILNDIRSIHSRKSYEPIIDKALNDKRLLKVDAGKIRNLLWGSSDIISEGDQASSEKDLLTSQQSDLISDGAASLIDKIYQQQNNVKLYQLAYHGTPHKFDKFSLDAIGTGEGAQAHGWGLYFARNKDVSESYRKTLTDLRRKTASSQVYEITENNIPIDEKLKDDIWDWLGGAARNLERADQKEVMIENIKQSLKRVEFDTSKDKEELALIKAALNLIENNPKTSVAQFKKSKEGKIVQDKVIYRLYEFSKERAEKENRKQNINDIKAELEEYFEKITIRNNSHSNYYNSVNALNLENLELRYKADFNMGQLFEVDIPEDEVLLDEDLPFCKQSEFIQEKVKELFNNEIENGEKYLKDIIKHNYNGKGIYETIRERKAFEKLGESLGGHYRNKFNDEFYKQASLLLNEYGIKGITYSDLRDGRCYVIFDDKAVKVLEKYYQKREEEPIQTNMLYDNITPRKLRNMNIKGAFVPAENLIELFKNADESTIIHEFAHWWLSRLEKYAEHNEELALDLAEVRKFLKNDGGAFTREQHEKFAVGFEAYIRNGSARSNRLKRIFEDFKNALIQIYDSIRQLVYTEDGNQYSFTEADVQNLERLFERLLTTENERIKKTVFDRCDDINDRIKEIKARQEEEMKELDELWKGNIAANNRASDKKRKVDEYLELAETAVNRVPKEVKEMKQRYKDATLSILSVATGMSKNAIANSRNWEKVQLALENADDKITVSRGMRAEWEEFYSDTGVNYDTDEVGGDFELAQKAFDVLTEGTYDFGNMNEDKIGKFYGKFDYLYNKVQTLKGEEKTTALEALYSLFNDIPSMPDEVTADLVEKLSKVEVDYDESQKEDFNRKHYPTISVAQQLQYYVTNKLSELKVYDPNVRYKVRISKSHSLYKAIKGATSVNSTKRIIRKINEYVIADLENQAKNILHKEIQKQIRLNSKLVKVGTISKGKFDWKTNTVFAELAQINKLKPKEALMEYGAIIELDKVSAGEEREGNNDNIVSTPEMKTDFQSNLKRKFLEYRSNKVKDLNLTATRSLLEDIMTLKFEGRRAKDEYELEKQLQKDNMKTDLVERVRELKGKKAAIGIAKFIMGETLVTSEKTLINWETANNALFGKEVAQRYSLLKLESDAEVYAYKRYSDFCKKAIDIYGLNNPVGFRQKAWHKFNEFVDFANNQPLVNLLQEYEEEVYNYKEVTYSKETGKFIETGVQLSRAEIITLYAWSMNEELEQRLFTQYGLHQVQHMFEQVLSEEDKQFAWLLIDTCEAMYEDNNEVFIRTMGLSLPKVANYFPSKTVRIGSEIDMLHENVVRSSNPSFIKQRKTCKRIKMKSESPLSILLPHINKTARYVILSERLNYLNAIFKDGTVRAAIKEVFDGIETPDKIQAGTKVKGKKNKKQRTVGDRIHDALLNQLGSSTFENYVRGINVGKSFMDYVATNYITSRIGGNFKVMFGQLTSMINYCENMPSGLWAKGFAECLKHPKETVKFMLENCDYLNARLAGNSMNEVMLKITDEADRFRSLRNFCTTNTKYGDLFAISFGGKPYVDYLMSQGLSKEEAIQKFVEDTMRSQQAGQASATSVWQKKQSEHPLTRMIFAFNNTTLQYERKFVDAMASKARGDISTKEFVKALLIYKVFNPILFTTFLTNLSFMTLIRGLFGDDEDGVEKFGVDVISSILTANLAAYGYLGMGLSTICSFAMTLIDKKEYKPFLKTVPIIGDLEEIGRNILLKNEVTVGDWVDAMALVTDDLTGIPATRLVNSATGLGDIAQGKFGVGALKMFGYGNYRANVAATGNPPEKK